MNEEDQFSKKMKELKTNQPQKETNQQSQQKQDENKKSTLDEKENQETKKTISIEPTEEDALQIIKKMKQNEALRQKTIEVNFAG